MKNLTVAVLLSSSPLLAQGFLELPATANPAQELPNFALPPFAQTDARVQLFFDATEVGSSSFTANELSFRWDGPLPQVGAPGPFNIQRMQIRVGTTTVGIPGARFADNLTSPLTTAFDSSVNYRPDPGVAAPHGWGDPNGSLTFAFAVPVAVTIPAGGWLVIDLQMEGNNFSQFGFAHTILDGVATTGGPVDGTVTPFGQGCSIDGSTPPVAISSGGIVAPGSAQFLGGQNLGANAPALVIFGLSNTQSLLGALPLTLNGTNCDVLVSQDATVFTVADASGELADFPFVPAAVPAFSGIVLHQQLAVFAPNANALGAAFSNAQTVTLGSLTAAGRGTWMVSNGADADATIATDVEAFGVAVRLGTQ